MLKPDIFSCSQKIQLKWDPPVLYKLLNIAMKITNHSNKYITCKRTCFPNYLPSTKLIIL